MLLLPQRKSTQGVERRLAFKRVKKAGRYFEKGAFFEAWGDIRGLNSFNFERDEFVLEICVGWYPQTENLAQQLTK